MNEAEENKNADAVCTDNKKKNLIQKNGDVKKKNVIDKTVLEKKMI